MLFGYSSLEFYVLRIYHFSIPTTPEEVGYEILKSVVNIKLLELMFHSFTFFPLKSWYFQFYFLVV